MSACWSYGFFWYLRKTFHGVSATLHSTMRKLKFLRELSDVNMFLNSQHEIDLGGRVM